jgi:hypothetical protein
MKCWKRCSACGPTQWLRHSAMLLPQQKLLSVGSFSMRTSLTKSKTKSKSCYDWRSVSQPVCLGVKFTVELVTRYYFLSESCCVVSVGRLLWREVGSVSCQSLSSVFSPLSKIQYNLHCTCKYMQNILDLCQHRLSTADHAKMYATTAV